MSRSTLIGRALESLDDAKLVAIQLNNALEEAGVCLPRAAVLQIIARLCGAHRFDELQHRLKGKSGAEPVATNAACEELRLLTLPELLLLRQAEGDGPLAGHLEFSDKNSATRWCYAMRAGAIKPAALEAARRLALGEPLRPLDTKWLTGRSSEVSVIDDDRVDGALHVDTRSLAMAGYLGQGKWSVGLDYYCRVSAYDSLLIERLGVPVGSKEMAETQMAAACFAPPTEFAAAGYEIFTVNIESRLMMRCLSLPNAEAMLESLWMLGQRWPEKRLRAALLRVDKGNAFRIIWVGGDRTQMLMSLGWVGTHGAGHGSSRAECEYSGAAGLARIWQEIGEWLTRPAGQLEEIAPAISSDRRAELQKWVEGGREWEQSAKATESS